MSRSALTCSRRRASRNTAQSSKASLNRSRSRDLTASPSVSTRQRPSATGSGLSAERRYSRKRGSKRPARGSTRRPRNPSCRPAPMCWTVSTTIAASCTAAIRTTGAKAFPSTRGATTSTRSVSNISRMAMRPSKGSRQAPTRSAPRVPRRTGRRATTFRLSRRAGSSRTRSRTAMSARICPGCSTWTRRSGRTSASGRR